LKIDIPNLIAGLVEAISGAVARAGEVVEWIADVIDRPVGKARWLVKVYTHRVIIDPLDIITLATFEENSNSFWHSPAAARHGAYEK
jgi:hypothetical protein